MAFWIFMLIMNLLIPFIMILFGFLFQKHPPKEINAVYGYRTTLSMKNDDTWKTAHLLCGRAWFLWGWIISMVSLVWMLMLFKASDTLCGIYGGILCLLQCIVLLLTLIPVERTLHSMFHEDGTRKIGYK